MYYKRAGNEGQHRSQMEKSRSWPSAHDWKSCIPQKGIEGSNPSFSAITPEILGFQVFFYFPFLSQGRICNHACSRPFAGLIWGLLTSVVILTNSDNYKKIKDFYFSRKIELCIIIPTQLKLFKRLFTAVFAPSCISGYTWE